MPNYNQDQAATIIQKHARGFFSRKKTDLYGLSEGKEIEIYIPLGIKKRTADCYQYDMIGGYGCILYESPLFVLQIDLMRFANSCSKYSIIEIATKAFCHPDAKKTNLPTEDTVDEAVGVFLELIETFAKTASLENKPTYITLAALVADYNLKQPKNPLRLEAHTKQYLQNPVHKSLFSDELEPVEEHQDIELLLIYDQDKPPVFDGADTPRTTLAQQVVNNNDYQSGTLLVHIQKTYSLPIDHYHPYYLANLPADFHITSSQHNCLLEAHQRAKGVVEKFPLPKQADHMRILGLLTLCAEKIITATTYHTGLHEPADKPVLFCRHILHYIKNIVCNDSEKQWFADLFQGHYADIKFLLSKGRYTGTAREYGQSSCSTIRYDAIFDLFGNFVNGTALSRNDINNPLSVEELKKMSAQGQSSWKNIYDFHIFITGRTHFNLQKITLSDDKNSYCPLFEARRIGLMTVQEFQENKSQVHLYPFSI